MQQQTQQILELNEQLNNTNNNNNQMQKIINMLQNQLVEKNEQLAKANYTIVELQKSKIDENVTRIPIQEVP
jgi:chromosome segregation ATPase